MVPNGFATTAQAYRDYLTHNGLEERIREALAQLDVDDVEALAVTGAQIRGWIVDAELPPRLASEITAAYAEMSAEHGADTDVAVRSSATAEDLPDASFAGQQETYLNISGTDHLLRTCKRVLASLFTDRAIHYRVDKGFEHMSIALSIGVQKMVRSDLGASGVMFTLDTESGFRDVVMVTSAYGLGENVVQGAVNPDEFLVFKPTLEQGHRPIIRRHLGEKAIKMIYSRDPVTAEATRNVPVKKQERQRFSISDDEVLQLARYAVVVERHYSAHAGKLRPMDIEWAKDGITGELFIVQARPETVHSMHTDAFQEIYTLKERGKILSTGKSVGAKVGCRKGTHHPRGGAHARPAARRGAGHRHHRPGLGTGHEDRQCHRHQPRRPRLPCGYRGARTRHPGRGRHRPRHQRHSRRQGGHRVLRRG